MLLLLTVESSLRDVLFCFKLTRTCNFIFLFPLPKLVAEI